MNSRRGLWYFWKLPKALGSREVPSGREERAEGETWGEEECVPILLPKELSHAACHLQSQTHKHW